MSIQSENQQVPQYDSQQEMNHSILLLHTISVCPLPQLYAYYHNSAKIIWLYFLYETLFPLLM
jgi:hypothetical protein